MDVDDFGDNEAIKEIMSPKKRNVKSPQAAPKSKRKSTSSGSHNTGPDLYGTFFIILAFLSVHILTQVSPIFPQPPLTLAHLYLNWLPTGSNITAHVVAMMQLLQSSSVSFLKYVRRGFWLTRLLLPLFAILSSVMVVYLTLIHFSL